MVSARADQSMTVLADGRVLVAGGSLPPGPAEIFDPVSETWSSTAPMVEGRFEHAASLLTDGRVLVAGGSWGEPRLNSAEIFDPDTGAWTPASPVPQPRLESGFDQQCGGCDDLAFALDGGRLLLITEQGAFVYDPPTDAWSVTGYMKQTRAHYAAVELADGRVLVAGGWIENGTKDLASAEVYDPESGTWSDVAPMRKAMSMFTATLLADDSVLVVGEDGSHSEVFDPQAGTWMGSGNPGADGHDGTATRLRDGRVLVAGGWDVELSLTSEEYNRFDTAVVYEPRTRLSSWRWLGGRRGVQQKGAARNRVAQPHEPENISIG